MDELDLEYVVADLDVVTRRLEKLRTSGRHGSAAEREQNAREEELLGRLAPELEEGRPLRELTWSDDDERIARGFRFLSQKPQLVVLNLDEAQLPEAETLESEARATHGGPGRDVIALAGRIEAEIAALPEADARPFLDDLGIAEASRDRVIGRTYALLGLFSFLTAGPDECRAWTIPTGATALDAAAAIHSDLARGFIRAEVVDWSDLVACGSTAEARQTGSAPLRGQGLSRAGRRRDRGTVQRRPLNRSGSVELHDNAAKLGRGFDQKGVLIATSRPTSRPPASRHRCR